MYKKVKLEPSHTYFSEEQIPFHETTTRLAYRVNRYQRAALSNKWLVDPARSRMYEPVLLRQSVTNC